MLKYPNIDPVAISVGPLSIHWYGITYLVAFLVGWWLAKRRAARKDSGWSQEEIGDLIFYVVLGVIVGGKLGSAVFYQTENLLANPLQTLNPMNGGMSFHGGFIGVVVAFFWYAKSTQRSVFQVSDFIAPCMAIGLGFGRIGNFINGELWGRVTDVPWGMVFPHVDNQIRHPNQLYQFIGEGIILFAIVWIYSSKKRPRMAVSGLFCIGYGVYRFIIEFFREPDRHLGFVALDWLTMGQNLFTGKIVNVRHPEYQYLDLIAQVLESGDQRVDRTGVGTRSLFGSMLRFDLSQGVVPILTTKRVYWKTAVKEMLWFLSGGTNIQPLLRENVRIWTDWPLASYRKESGEQISQESFEQRIIDDDEFAARWGELGPVYGKQWRRWMGADGREHDQIDDLITTLRENPSSRRMLFHGWNVAELETMALPPCHMVYQYHVTSDGKLNCLLLQRSVDLFLGAPFNFVGAVSLQLMLAQQAGLTPGELVWVGGDTHLYLNHFDQANELLKRKPRPFPQMKLTRTAASIDDYRIDDFEVKGYAPHDVIKADVAV